MSHTKLNLSEFTMDAVTIPDAGALGDTLENEDGTSSTLSNSVDTESEGKIEVPVLNGNCFSDRNIYVPPELLEQILSYCDYNSLTRLPEVCRTWYQVFHTEYFWYCVMKNRGLETEWAPTCAHLNNHPDSWQVYFSIVKFNFLNRNLVRNPSGGEGFANWTFLSGESGGWTVETIDYRHIIPSLLPESSDGSSCCFATNQFSCSKEQTIDLWSQGLTPPVMRACIPFMITWSELVTTPVGHSGIYEAKVSFLDTDLGPFISPYSRYDYKVRTNVGINGISWKLFSQTFVVTWKNAHEVIDDLRYFYIYHGAMDNSDIEGHFGPKISRTSLKISLINT